MTSWIERKMSGLPVVDPPATPSNRLRCIALWVTPQWFPAVLGDDVINEMREFLETLADEMEEKQP